RCGSRWGRGHRHDVGMLRVGLQLDPGFVLANVVFFFKQKTAYEVGLGIPAEPLFRSLAKYVALWLQYAHRSSLHAGRFFTFWLVVACDRSEERSAGMPRPISYAVFCLKKKNKKNRYRTQL